MKFSLTDKGKKMGFKEFVKKFGKFFKSLPEKDRVKKMESTYTGLTGKPVSHSKPKKED